MVVPGIDCKNQSSTNEIAKMTFNCLTDNVPSEVPGIAFLSGGQSEIESTRNLNEINKINNTDFIFTYSYGRALQQSALNYWGKNPEDVNNIQKIFNHRAKMNSLSTSGKWVKELDKIDAEEAARTPIGGWESDLSRSEALKIAKSDWAKKQGKTQAPLANLLTIGPVAAGAAAAAPGAVTSLGKGLAKDWANRTLSDAAWAKFQKTGKMPKGLKGWRPIKAGSWKQLKTGATVQAERLLQGLGISGGITALSLIHI